MCTLTIHRTPDGYSLSMNRDELRSRGPEQPPVLHSDSAPRASWAAPVDTPTGGTWLGANDCGVAACLLNRYAESAESTESTETARAPEGVSRGFILPALLPLGGPEAVAAHLAGEFDPSRYAPFDLFIVHQGGVERHTWNGAGRMQTTTCRDEWFCFASSSWRQDEVAAHREELFHLWIRRGADERHGFPGLHLYRESGRERYAPIMDRPESHTRSLSRVEVEYATGAVRLRYWPREDLDSGRPPRVLLLSARERSGPTAP